MRNKNQAAPLGEGPCDALWPLTFFLLLTGDLGKLSPRNVSIYH